MAVNCMNFLQTVLEHKKQELVARKRTMLRSTLEDMPLYSEPRCSFINAIRGKDLAVIAGVRKTMARGGVSRADFDPLAIARQYERAGASALSVQTDERFFLGRVEFIRRIRQFMGIPILRKDFIIDPYQLYESRAYGADAVSLSVGALEGQRLQELHAEAHDLGLDVLVEVHSEDELDALDFSRVSLVGINNKDPMTLEPDVMNSVRIRKYIPPQVVITSENGIRSSKDLELLMGHGITTVLVDGYLLTAHDSGIRQLSFVRE